MTKPVHRSPISAWALACLLALFGASAVPASAQPAAPQAAVNAGNDQAKPRAPVKRKKVAARKPVATARTAVTPPAAAPTVNPSAVTQTVSARTTSAPTAAASVAEADYIVAVVNTEPVTNNEVRARMARAERQLRERNVPMPPAEQLRHDVLERLIAERAQLQYARDQGMKVDDEALTQAELSIARQNDLTVPELHRQLAREGIALRDFRDDVRNQVLLARLREREIEPRIRVTEPEVDEYIREQTGNQAAAQQEINLAMILVAVPEQADAAERSRLEARAQEVTRRARAGEDFAALATEFSDANRRGRDGGELGLRPTAQYPSLFVDSVARARVGDVVGPVRSDAGLHVLKLLERKRSTVLPVVNVPQTHLRHILLVPGATQSVQVARERLQDFKRRIESGQARFENLAEQYSQDPSARDGGDLGWANPGQFSPEVERVIRQLGKGQLSDIVTTRLGLHLLQVLDRREIALSGADQRELARNVLREQRTEEAFATWAQEVRGRAYVEYRDPPR